MTHGRVTSSLRYNEAKHRWSSMFRLPEGTQCVCARGIEALSDESGARMGACDTIHTQRSAWTVVTVSGPLYAAEPVEPCTVELLGEWHGDGTVFVAHGIVLHRDDKSVEE